jgi:hypothetical protein
MIWTPDAILGSLVDCRNELPNEQQNRVPGVGTTCREPDPPDNFITFKPLTHSPTTRFPSNSS